MSEDAKKIIVWMKENNVKKIEMNFSGSGDSGAIDNVVAWDDSGDIKIDASTEETIVDFGSNALSQYYDGWENNDGGYGTIVILTDGKCNIEVTFLTPVEESTSFSLVEESNTNEMEI